MGFEKWRRIRGQAEVDLIPVMNLFVVLIPFLLLSAAFFHVGVIPTSLPSQSAGKTDIAASERAVTVTLQVNADEVHISAASTVLDEETLAALSLTIPRTDEGYDLDLLSRALYQIKQMYEESDTVILLAGEGVVYRDVITVLDVTRERTLNEGTPNEVRVPLFPVVVLSRRV
ncbi:MAG: biopolymer transporter ExbD [Deltaproteobacteria bacterium]|nr:biopolymer transporter ExbD [Deltaproteobacteria bacterium]